MKFDIFISYSRKDFDEVSSILEFLRTSIPGLTYWFDIDGIESGDEFQDKIISAIDNSHTYCSLCPRTPFHQSGQRTR